MGVHMGVDKIMCSVCECDVEQALVCVHVCGVTGGEMKEHESTTVYNTFHNVFAIEWKDGPAQPPRLAIATRPTIQQNGMKRCDTKDAVTHHIAYNSFIPILLPILMPAASTSSKSRARTHLYMYVQVARPF